MHFLADTTPAPATFQKPVHSFTTEWLPSDEMMPRAMELVCTGAGCTSHVRNALEIEETKRSDTPALNQTVPILLLVRPNLPPYTPTLAALAKCHPASAILATDNLFKALTAYSGDYRQIIIVGLEITDFDTEFLCKLSSTLQKTIILLRDRR